MTRKRFKEYEIRKILQEYEDGTPIQQIIEQYGISQATFYNWKAKYRNQLLFDIQHINKLKEDNERLKRMFADLSLENLALKAQLKKIEKY
ncbi:MAG TPA: transposase [Mariniphaga sp.]|nr:transposase [Mariniphaga sp.]